MIATRVAESELPNENQRSRQTKKNPTDINAAKKPRRTQRKSTQPDTGSRWCRPSGSRWRRPRTHAVAQFTNFFKHRFAKHKGEVAMVNVEERRALLNRDGNWPATFFHLQFAIKADDRNRWGHRRRSAAGDYVTVAEAAKIGSATFVEFTVEGDAATFKVAKVLSLPELFLLGARTVHWP